jgi:hypothetical protein
MDFSQNPTIPALVFTNITTANLQEDRNQGGVLADNDHCREAGEYSIASLKLPKADVKPVVWNASAGPRGRVDAAERHFGPRTPQAAIAWTRAVA